MYEEIKQHLPIGVTREEYRKFTIYPSKTEIKVGDLLKLTTRDGNGEEGISPNIIDSYFRRLYNKYKRFRYIHTKYATQIAKGHFPSKTFTEVIGVPTQEAFAGKQHFWPVESDDGEWFAILIDWENNVFSVFDLMARFEQRRDSAENIMKYYMLFKPDITRRQPEILHEYNNEKERRRENTGVYVLRVATMSMTKFFKHSFSEFKTRMFVEFITRKLIPAGDTPSMANIEEIRECLREIECHILKSDGDEKNGKGETKPDLNKLKERVFTYAEETNSNENAATERDMRLPSTSACCWCCGGKVSKPSTCNSSPPSTIDLSESQSPPPPNETPTDVKQVEIVLERYWQISPAVESHFRNVKDLLSAEEWEDPDFQYMLFHESAIRSKAKPMSYIPQPKQDKESERRKAFKILQEKGYIDEEEPYGYRKLNMFKKELAPLTYDEGMSGDERAPLTEPLDRSLKNEAYIQCTLCEFVSAGYYHAQEHVEARHCIDTCLQRVDVYNRDQARINVRRLKTKASRAALYIQKAPNKPCPNRYKLVSSGEKSEEEKSPKQSAESPVAGSSTTKIKRRKLVLPSSSSDDE